METLDTVKVESPSFPEVTSNCPIKINEQKLWQVLCGDAGHWRVGIYSPDTDAFGGLKRFERHSCPEFFILLSGNISLSLVKNGKLETLVLEPMKPVLVDTWHSAFCPNGRYTGTALVVERDEFTTEYKASSELLSH